MGRGLGSGIEVELSGGDHKMKTEESTDCYVCLHLSGSQVKLRVKLSSYFYFTDGEIL